LTPEGLGPLGNTAALTIEFYFDQMVDSLIQQVNKHSFLLNCTPVVNVFSYQMEPIDLSAVQTEYKIIPDARQTDSMEVHTIKSVTAYSSHNDVVNYWPFYGVKHSLDTAQNKTFWQSSRRPIASKEGIIGYDTYLTLINLNASEDTAVDWVVQVTALCTNRNLPRQMALTNQALKWQLEKSPIPLSVQDIAAPTASFYYEEEGDRAWRLVSHLSLNHLSLIQAEGDTSALSEILKLYDPNNAGASLINGIKQISSKRILMRDPQAGANAFINGTEVTMVFDSSHYPQGMLFLFTHVLARFLNLYCSINSFVKLVVMVDNAVFYEWEPMFGELCLV